MVATALSSAQLSLNYEKPRSAHTQYTTTYSYAQFYPRASGTHGRLTVPAMQNDSALVLFNTATLTVPFS